MPRADQYEYYTDELDYDPAVAGDSSPTVDAQHVLLPTGKVIPLSYVELAANGTRFFYGSFDVTDSLTYWQKRSFLRYNFTLDNELLSDKNTRAQGREIVQPQSAVGVFFRGVGSDIASVADNARSFLGIGAENAGKLSGLTKLLLFAAALAGLYLVFRIVQTAKAA